MEEYMELTIYHNGRFVDDDHSVYEEGAISNLRIDTDTWSYFEFVGVLKDLGYREFEKIWYKDPSLGMSELVDDKGALEINDIYRVHKKCDIYIQHTIAEPEYCQFLIEEVTNAVSETVEEEVHVIAGETDVRETVVEEVNVGGGMKL